MRYYATKRFNYGGQDLSQGQIIELKGFKNDQALIEHKYFLPVPENAELVCCDECGAELLGETALRVHWYHKHQERQRQKQAI